MATATLTNPTPGTPEPIEYKEVEYVLTYRERRVLQHINFKWFGPWDDALEAAKKYCRLNNLEFINIEYMYINIKNIIDRPKKKDTSHIVRGINYKPEDSDE